MYSAEAIQYVIDHEGGYVNDPSDPGGETKYGISKRSYPDVDIKNLSLKNARIIYENDWWYKYSAFANVANLHQQLGIKYFDASVNMGVSSASKALQRSLRACGQSVIPDGIVGSRTILALQDLVLGPTPHESPVAAYRSELAGHYRVLIARNSDLKKFKNGWLARAYE